MRPPFPRWLASSLLFLLTAGCTAAVPSLTGGPVDGGNEPEASDAGRADAGGDAGGDAGTADGGEPHPSSPDAGTPEPGDAGPPPQTHQGDGVGFVTDGVNGIRVDRYTWTDSAGRPRTVSLKRQGEGNPGNGGYAVQITYEHLVGAAWQPIVLGGTGGGEQGFGYFVAHEHYRSFDDNSSGTIAAVHGEDDSPLGLDFAVAATPAVLSPSSTVATHSFTTTYPKWGTVAAMGDVDAVTPKAAASHQKFVLPLSIQWTFEKGRDFPRIDLKLDLTQVTAGQLAFDVRGPYGVLEFANGDSNATLNNVQWGDSAYHFTTQSAASGDLTTTAGWDWAQAIGATRPYHALLARHPTSSALYELGLFEQKVGADTGLVYSGYSDHRGGSRTSTGHDLLSASFQDWEWPFQSAQYAGLSQGAPATGKKFAWGSSSLYGSLATVQYLTSTQSVPLTAFPGSKALLYRTCLVFGVSPFTDANRKGITRAAAESATPSCPTAAPLN